METKNLIRQFREEPKSQSVHYQKPIDKGMITDLQEIADFKPPTGKDFEMYSMGFEQGQYSKRAEVIAMVMNLTKDNPNVSVLEILKKL
jgi:hypothetical protein